MYSYSSNAQIDTLGVQDSTAIINGLKLNEQDTTPYKTGSYKISKDGLEEEVQYKAKDSIVYAIAEQKIYLYGLAVIDYKDLHLEGDRVTIDWNKNLIHANGTRDSTGALVNTPKIIDKGKEFAADSMLYNFKSRKGKIYNLKTQEGAGYVHAENVKKDANDVLYCENAKYTTCDADDPHFWLHLKKAKIIPKDKVITSYAYFVIEDIPIYPLGVPFGFFPTNTKTASSGLLFPQYGFSNGRGYYLTNGGYYFAISDKVDLAVTGDIYSFGSWGAAAKSRYKVRYKYSGQTEFKFNKNFFENDLGEFEPTNEFRINWSHTQDPKSIPNMSFSASVEAGSANFNRNNSFNNNEILDNRLRSSINFSKNFNKIPLRFSAALNHDQNRSDSSINLTLPNASLNLSRRITPFESIKPKSLIWLKNLGFNHNINFKNSISTKDKYLFSPDTNVLWNLGLNHNLPLSTSFTFRKYISINPSFNYRGYLNFYDVNKAYNEKGAIEEDRQKDFSYEYDYSFNTNDSTRIHGMLNFNKSEKLVALRHVMTPSLTFTYTPDFTQSKYGYYKYAVNEKDTLSNGELRSSRYNRYEDNPTGSPIAGKVGSIGFNLLNAFELKANDRSDTTKENATKKIKILDALNANMSYNFFADSLNLSDLNLTARTVLFKNININSTARYNPYAVDSLGVKYNEFLWNKEQQLLSLQSFNLNVSTSLSQALLKKLKKKSKLPPSRSFAPGEGNGFRKVQMPFDIRVGYDFTVNRIAGEFNPIQTVSLNGNWQFTNKWRVNYTLNYDLELKELGFANFKLTRDLHCWEFSFDWTPTGYRQGFYFTLRAKASELQSLKLDKNSFFYDN